VDPRFIDYTIASISNPSNLGSPRNGRLGMVIEW
jgi:hypothetical protein